MKILWAWLGALGTVVLASGCLSSYGCPSQPCEDGFAANLELSSGNWEDGTYVFTVDDGGDPVSCTLVMPVAANAEAACTTDQMGILIAGDTPTQVELLGTPSSVTVTVSRDGTELVSKTFSPTYTSLQTCGATCQGAVETLTIP